MLEVDDDNKSILTIYVLLSDNKSLNRKTLNSLSLLDEFNITIKWIKALDELKLIDPAKSTQFSMFMNSGDHIARSFLETFFKKPLSFLLAYQAEYSYLFSDRGKVFYRKNIDITPETDEVNALMLYPHNSRHIIFPTNFIDSVIKKNDHIMRNFYWILAQTLIENNLLIVTLKSCITLEYFDVKSLQNEEQIFQFCDPVVSEIFDKNKLLLNQNFSNLYE